MKVTIAKHSGYCAGVARAVRMLEKELEQAQCPVYVLGEIIHNPRVVAGLEQRGAKPITEKLNVFPKGAVVVVASHGANAEIVDELRRRGAKIVDATCPHVAAVHAKIQAAHRAHRRVFVAGQPGHAEVNAFPGPIHVLSSGDQARRFKPDQAPSFLTAQTTFSKKIFSDIEAALGERIWDLDVFDSLCGHALRAQQAARALASKSDFMIVVGGKNSANTGRLRHACREAGARVRHIESTSELRPGLFQPGHRVGITAGASTPQSHIREVEAWLAKRFEIE